MRSAIVAIRLTLHGCAGQPCCRVPPRAGQRGFTLTELVATIVIIGILATVAIPRFFTKSQYDSRGFYDQAIAVLRYAQKSAIAQRRYICVAFTSSSITLSYDPNPPSSTYTTASCPGSPMVLPATGQTPYTVSAPSDVTLSGYSNFYFSSLGRPSAAQSISVSGYTASQITVSQETGFVH